MTNIDALRAKIVADLKAMPLFIAALGTDAEAADIIEFERGFLQEELLRFIQSQEPPFAVVTHAGSNQAQPGTGDWYIHSFAVYIRPDEGGSYGDALNRMHDSIVSPSTQRWIDSCVVANETKQPDNWGMNAELLGLIDPVIEVVVVRFTVADRVP